MALALSVSLGGCVGPFVDTVQMSKIPPEEAQAALAVKLYMQSASQPENVEKYLGSVEAYSCKNKVWDKPVSTGDALAQLRLKTLRMGGNAVIGVTTDTRGTDTLGTNCWESVQASGTAVVIP